MKNVTLLFLTLLLAALVLADTSRRVYGRTPYASSADQLHLPSQSGYSLTEKKADTVKNMVERTNGSDVEPVNLALGKPAVASSVESIRLPAHHVNDGNPDTRWSSDWEDNEWIYIDLGADYEVQQVLLNWETAYGESYDIDISFDGIDWETIFEERDGNGGLDNIDLDTPVTARFVRMAGLVRGTAFGFSLWEFEIYGVDPTRRYVDGTGQDVGNNCLDPDIPCATITYAINQAGPGNTIQIAAGDYTESLTINKSLILQGAGQGNTNIQAHAQPGMASSRVITIPQGLSVDFANLTIRHGRATGGGSSGRGGGISNAGSALTLSNVTFHRNEATYGGGMYNNNSSPVLTDVTFSQNTANDQGQGGGMYNFNSSPSLTSVTFSQNTANNNGGGMSNTGNSSPTLTNVTFTENKANEGGGGIRNTSGSSPRLSSVEFNGNEAKLGGGLYNVSSSPVLTGVTFSHNSAGDHGGGIYNDDGEITIAHSTIVGNTTGGFGGGIHNHLGELIVTYVAMTGNQADLGGGIYNYFDSVATLKNSEITGNSAERSGGGIYNDDGGTMALTNARIAGNTASIHGGGIYNNDAPITITNATIASNEAAETGGGIHSEGEAALTNTIIWSNTAVTDGNELWNHADTTLELRYSLYKNETGDIVEGGTFDVDANSLTTDPLFVDAANGDLHLQDGSPAINTGDPNTNLFLFPGDADGNPVDLDDKPRVQDGRIDMGAFEYSRSLDQLYLPLVTK